MSWSSESGLRLKLHKNMMPRNSSLYSSCFVCCWGDKGAEIHRKPELDTASAFLEDQNPYFTRKELRLKDTKQLA